MEARRDVKPQDLPHPLDWFCARLRAARIRFRATATDRGMSVEIVYLKNMPRALAIWLGTRREEAGTCGV
jgi:hypothetical protein